MSARVYKTKRIRPLSTTKSGGHVISPSAELRRLKEGHFLVVDDAKSRHHMVNAAHRLNIHITTRRSAKGYEIHRLAKPQPMIQDYVNINNA